MTGTTVMELVKLLPQKKDLTVVVNDIQFAAWLQQNSDFKIYVLSGVLRNNYNYVTSPMKCELLSILNIDKVFLTCNGFTKEAGATTPDLGNALKIQEVIERSCFVFVLCDSSKIGSVSFAHIVGIDQIDTLFTDGGILEDDAAGFSGSVNTVVAPIERE
jgi:DeoR family fructose operon transcriptional repressor